jgi:hypothetical protein
MAIRDDVVATGESQLGSTNALKYLSFCGYYSYTDWCAAFVTWVFGQHGLAGKAVPITINCTPGRQWFIDRGAYRTDKATYQPLPGDVIYYHWSTGTPGKVQHVGIVRYSDADYVYTVEGNVNFINGVSRVGYKKRLRSYSSIDGYGIPLYDNQIPDDPTPPEEPDENPYDPPDEYKRRITMNKFKWWLYLKKRG